MRSLNYWGSGILGLQEALDGLHDIFNYLPWQLDRHLKQGKSQLWDIYPHNRRPTIKIWSLEKVCEYLGTSLECNKYFRDIPAEKFISLKTRRSQLYASIHQPAGIKGNPISRESITEYTGLNKVQQRRYEQEVGVKRTPQYAMQQDQEGKMIPVKQEIFTKKEGYRLVNKRLGNIYHSEQRASSQGMLRKTSAKLKGKRSCLPEGAQKPLVKRFFKGMRKLVRQILAPKGISEGYYLIPPSKRHILGRMEWCQLCKT